ncbi:MAG TPA: hypothetical protein VF585_04030 [Chthoniobacterales bacterium]|jgi:hypothetical protein
MKPLIFLLTLGLAFTTSKLSATDVVLEGPWSASLNSSRTYFSSGRAQSGRLQRTGPGYYRFGRLAGGDIANNDPDFFSGPLSLNFWRLNFYGGTTGNLLFTRGFNELPPDSFYPDVYRAGYFRSPGRRGYGDISLEEFDFDFGWEEADNIPFSAFRYY